MTRIIDRFDRASMGADWEVPWQQGVGIGGTIQISPDRDAAQADPDNLGGSYYSYARWAANEFNPYYMYAEYEWASPTKLDWTNYQAGYYDWTLHGIILNFPTIAEGQTPGNEGDKIEAQFGVNTSPSNPQTLYVRLRELDENFDTISSVEVYADLNDYLDAFTFTAGCKFRVERVWDKVYCFFYSNQRNRWYKLPIELDATLNPTNLHTGTGFYLYTFVEAQDAEITNYKSGDDLADFLGPTMLGIDIPDGVVETLAADGSTTAVDTKGPVYVTVSGGTWGGGTLQIERQNSAGEWKNIVDGSFTADFAKVLHFPSGAENSIRATLSGSTSPDLDVEVQAASPER